MDPSICKIYKSNQSFKDRSFKDIRSKRKFKTHTHMHTYLTKIDAKYTERINDNCRKGI